MKSRECYVEKIFEKIFVLDETFSDKMTLEAEKSN